MSFIYIWSEIFGSPWSQTRRPMEALTYVSLPTRFSMFTCIVKIAQGDWNRRNLEPPCPSYLASLLARSVTGRSHSIYVELTGHTRLGWFTICNMFKICDTCSCTKKKALWLHISWFVQYFHNKVKHPDSEARVKR